jgi:hypothetical protein
LTLNVFIEVKFVVNCNPEELEIVYDLDLTVFYWNFNWHLFAHPFVCDKHEKISVPTDIKFVERAPIKQILLEFINKRI